MTMTELLVQKGCRRWQKAGKDRIYLPVELMMSLIGLKLHRYGSGNISSATQNGEKISNSSAREILNDMDGAYYDIQTNKFVSTYAEVSRKLREELAAYETP
jgi:hypothetical protein